MSAVIRPRGAAVAPVRRLAPASPAPQRRTSLTVVTDRRSARRRAGLLASVSLVIAFGLLFAIVAVQAVIAQGQQRLDALQRQVTVERQANQRLRLVVAELESPRTVAAAAQRRLGMVRPEEVTYLTPSGDAAIEARLAAQAAPAVTGR